MASLSAYDSPVYSASVVERAISVSSWLFHKTGHPLYLLSNHNLANIRKQNYIGTRKHNSEAVEGAKQEHRIKDSDGSRSGRFSDNIQGTTLQTTGDDDKSGEQADAEVEQRGGENGVVEPRSYRDVLVNG